MLDLGGDAASDSGGSAPAEAGDGADGGTPMAGPTAIPNTCALGGSLTGAPGWIVFDSDALELVRHIFAVRASDCALLQLTSGPHAEQEPAVSPDGKTLVFSSNRSSDGSMQLFSMDLASQTLRQLTSQTGGAGQAVFSPDGTSIAYHSAPDVYLMAADGSDDHVVVVSPDGADYEHPAFSPDGASILVDRTNEIDAFGLDGHDEGYVVNNTTQEEFYPAPSPDGVSLAYVTGCDASVGDPTIMVSMLATPVYPCDAQQWNQPNFGTISHPSWGSVSWIAFAHIGSSGLNHVALSNANQGVADLVDDYGDQRNPQWAPPTFDPGTN
ncbi:MAG TPA: hypothetical protein VHS09_12465 [Polyangiaceae bacterium]|nr:hypothetical protein [Polyangiaceae bacterium]